MAYEKTSESKAMAVLRFFTSNWIYLAIIVAVTLACYALHPLTWKQSWGKSHLHAAYLSLFAVALVDFFHLLRRKYGDYTWPWWFALGGALSVPLVYFLLHLEEKHPGLSGLWFVASVVAAAVFILAVGLCTRLREAPRFLVKVAAMVLVSACIFGTFNYYKFSKNVFGLVDNMDVCYYFSNSRFFPELGYYDFYPAMLAADEEGQNRLRSVQRFRDLHNYRIVGRPQYLTKERKEAIKAQFTPERWEDFKKDVDYWISHPPGNGWSYFFTDHGYNPPPTWTVIGGTIANLTPIAKVKYVTMIDFALVALVCIVISRTLGVETMLFSLLWYASTFSGRWPMVGTALLRHDWVCALALSVCLLAPGRRWPHARRVLAGAFMGYAAMVRIFPAVFFWAYGVKTLQDFAAWLRKREALPVRHLYFAAGAAAMVVLVAGGALVKLGPSALQQSKENLSMHASSYTAHRVGLGDAVFYRGEKTTQDVNAHGGISGKKALIEKAKPKFYFLFVIWLGIIALHVVRSKEPIHRHIHWAMIPLFFVTNAQINYYNMRILLVMWHASDLGKQRHKYGLALLFLTEVATQAAYVAGWTRYAVTATSSLCLCVYFLFLTGIMVFEILRSFGFFPPEQESGPGEGPEENHREPETVPAGA